MSVVVSFGYKTAARHFFSLIFDNKDAHSNDDVHDDDDDDAIVVVMSHRSAEDQKVSVIRLDRSID